MNRRLFCCPLNWSARSFVCTLAFQQRIVLLSLFALGTIMKCSDTWKVFSKCPQFVCRGPFHSREIPIKVRDNSCLIRQMSFVFLGKAFKFNFERNKNAVCLASSWTKKEKAASRNEFLRLRCPDGFRWTKKRKALIAILHSAIDMWAGFKVSRNNPSDKKSCNRQTLARGSKYHLLSTSFFSSTSCGLLVEFLHPFGNSGGGTWCKRKFVFERLFLRSRKLHPNAIPRRLVDLLTALFRFFSDFQDVFDNKLLRFTR